MASTAPTQSKWRARFAAAILLTVCGSVVGLVVNSVRGNGLSLSYTKLDEDGTLDPVQSLADEGGTVDLTAVRVAIDEGSAIVVDARPRSDFEEGHIPGAFSLPFDDFADPFARFAEIFPQATALIAYCTGGSCTDSVTVRNELVDHGYIDVKLFAGGWEEWSAAGLPTDTGPDPLSAVAEN